MNIFLLVGYTLLSAGQQGILTWLLRAYVPPGRQGLVNLALHLGGGLLYGLLLAGVGGLGPPLTPGGWLHLLVPPSTGGRASRPPPCLRWVPRPLPTGPCARWPPGCACRPRACACCCGWPARRGRWPGRCGARPAPGIGQSAIY